MPPRRRTKGSAAASAPSPALTVLNLPDELLLRCLAPLEQQERCEQRTAELRI